MKKKISFVVFLMLTSFLNAQQTKIDSLAQLFTKEKQDTIRARLLAEIGIAAYRTDFSLAKLMNDSLISFSKKHSERFLAQGYRMKGTYAMLEGNYDISLIEYNKALSIVQRLGRKDIEADYLSNYATLYNYKGDEEKSEEYYLKSINLNKELGRDTRNITSYINLALKARRNNNVEKSIEYLINALSLSENSKEQPRLEYIHSELAKGYMILSQYKKTEFHLDNALKIALRKNDVGALANIYSAFGYLSETRDDSPQLALKFYEKSLSNYLKAGGQGDIINTYYNVGLQNIKLNNLEIAQSQSEEGLRRNQIMNDRNKEIYGNLQLADIYIRKHQIEKGKNLIKKAETELEDLSSIDYRQQYFRIAKAFESVGNYRESAKYIEKYTILSDSLYQKNSLDKIAEVEERYESKKKENEILRLENENIIQKLTNQEQQSKLRLLGIGIFLLICGIGVFYFYYRKNKKQKEIIESLQRELHHRVKNNLVVIDTFIVLAKKGVDDSVIRGKLTELQNRIDSINFIHEQLYKADDVTQLNIEEYIHKLSKSIQDSFNNTKIKVEENIDSDIYLNSNKAFSLGIIVNEFLINSFKHAFNDMNEGIITIFLRENKNDYEINLSDNGVGLPENLNIDDLDSFGLDIMKISTEQLEGSFDVKNNNGAVVAITFPK